MGKVLYWAAEKKGGMRVYTAVLIREHAERMEEAAEWFAGKWGIPAAEYLASMRASAAGGGAVPQWYLLLDGDGRIAGGCGVIENDFHERRDLAPNLCALFVEPAHRRRGLARRLVDLALDDMAGLGLGRLYLITDHEGLYERMGWSFIGTVRCDGGELSRMYASPQRG